MVDEFKAKIVDGKLVIQPIIINDGKNVTVQLPSLSIINDFQNKLREQGLLE